MLVEQEWCAFGHQFRARSGHADSQAGYWEDESTSPVFMQFVDAVWQLMRQFPCSFEFSERYLIALLDEVYNKRSGTFLYDCEEARMVCDIFIGCQCRNLFANRAGCLYTRGPRRFSDAPAPGR